MKHAFRWSLFLGVWPFLAVFGAESESVPLPAPPGTVFHCFGLPYLAGLIVFEDPSGEKAPEFFYELPSQDLKGKLVFDPGAPRLECALTCHNHCNPSKAVEVKLLAERVRQNEKLTAGFTVKGMGPWEPQPASKDSTGRSIPANPFAQSTIQAELELDGKKIPIRCQATLQFSPGKSGQICPQVAIRAQFTVKGKELGLQGMAERDIGVCVSVRAYPEERILAEKKKRSLKEAGVKE